MLYYSTKNLKNAALILSAALLIGCEKTNFEVTSETLEQNYATMVAQDDSIYLRNKLYENELQYFLPLINYLNNKQNENTSNRSSGGVRFISFSLREASVRDIVNLLRPLEGYYPSCSAAIGPVFFSPEIVAYYAVSNSTTLDRKSLKVQALIAEIEQRIEWLTQVDEIKPYLIDYLKQNQIPFDGNPYQLKQAIHLILGDNDAIKMFMNPRIIYCKPLSLNQLAVLENNFKKFNQYHKPLNFNEMVLEKGFYDERENR